MPYSAIKVANEILRLAAAGQPPSLVTPLKLIKLVYVANGWSLALHNHALVHEAAEAWTYGPVMPALYASIRHFRASPIQGPIAGDYDQNVFQPEDTQLIAAVVTAYGHLSGTQLSNMTHRPGTPWSITWNGGNGQNDQIPSALIAEHYRNLAAARQAL
jgi:uncharacterized phage-associated protein